MSNCVWILVIRPINGDFTNINKSPILNFIYWHSCQKVYRYGILGRRMSEFTHSVLVLRLSLNWIVRGIKKVKIFSNLH